MAPDRAHPDLTSLVRAHGPWVLSWFRRRVAPSDAEDLAQEAMVALVRSAHRLRDPQRAAGYLRRVVKTTLRNHARRAGPVPMGLPDPAIDTAEPEQRERLAVVAAGVAALPPELETVIDVHYSRQLTYEQTAAVLGINRATVQSRLRRALGLLRAHVERAYGPTAQRERGTA